MLNPLKSLADLEKMSNVGEIVSGAKDLLWMLRIFDRVEGEGGKPHGYRLSPGAARTLKIPAKWIGSHTDEIVWQKIMNELDATDAGMINEWLDYLRIFRQNDDLIYFFGKACETMAPAEAAKSLHRYLALRDSVTSDQLYPAMTRAAIADHILEAEPLADYIQKAWREHIWPAIKNGSKEIKEKAIAVLTKNHTWLKKDNERLEAKLATLRKKRTGSI